MYVRGLFRNEHSYRDTLHDTVMREFGGGAHYDAVVQGCEAVGFSPTLGQEAPQLTSIVTLVAAGMGVSVLPSTMAQLRAEGVTYIATSGPAPEALLAAAFRSRNQTPALTYTLTLMREDLERQE